VYGVRDAAYAASRHILGCQRLYDCRPRERLFTSTTLKPVAFAMASWRSSADTNVVHMARCEAATCNKSTLRVNDLAV
jgi:hypothetical protein